MAGKIILSIATLCLLVVGCNDGLESRIQTETIKLHRMQDKFNKLAEESEAILAKSGSALREFKNNKTKLDETDFSGDQKTDALIDVAEQGMHSSALADAATEKALENMEMLTQLEQQISSQLKLIKTLEGQR